MKKIIGYSLILISAVLWGAIPLFTRYLYASGLEPLDVASLRSYATAAVSVVLLILTGDLKKLRLKEIPFYIVYSMVAISGVFICYAWSVNLLPTAMACILMYTSPIFVNVLNRVIYKIPFTRTKIVSVILTIAGCALVVRIYDPGSLVMNALGILMGIGSGICYSMTTIFGTKANTMHPGRVNSLTVLTFSVIPFLFLRSPSVLFHLEGHQMMNLVGLAVICTVAPYVLYLMGMEMEIDSGNAAIISIVEPVAAAVLGVIAFGDRIEFWQIIGMGVVLAGCVAPYILKKTE